MFYHLLAPLSKFSIFFNVFHYITFRALAAFITALLLSLFLGPLFIRMLKRHKAQEQINDVVPEGHKAKQGTPTMGGLIILSTLVLTSLLWNNLVNSYILLTLITTLWLGGLGFFDDYLKNFRKLKEGMLARYKLIGQIFLGTIIAFALYLSAPENATITNVAVPFFKQLIIPLGIFFIPFVVFVIVGSSNAVNLTDGLDGLAAGCIAFCAFSLAVLAYLKGNINLAARFHLEFIPEAGELTIFISALIGCTIGFLWYNTSPAEVFMGDTGSLAIGGILAVLAVLLREELFFAITGGVFIVEALSSMIQRYYFKFWRIKTGEGRRFFRRAPLHHHFEMGGLKEQKIVVRFWIIAALLAAVGLATLKLR